MSRWLYVFAVITPSAATRLREVIARTATDPEVPLPDVWVHELLLEDHRRIVHYKAVLDGWFGLGQILNVSLHPVQVQCPELKAILTRALEEEWAQVIGAEAMARIATDGCRLRPGADTQIGSHEAIEIARSVNDWVHWSKVTRCPALFSVRAIGPSMDDAEFQHL